MPDDTLFILKTFNYNECLDLYNQSHKKQYSHNECFGLSALSAEFLNQLKAGVDLINSAPLLFLFTDEEITFNRARRETIEKVQELMLAGKLQHIPLPSDSQGLIKSIALKMNRLEWMKKQKNVFDNENTWQSIAVKNINATKIQQEWKGISSTACWNNEQIGHIAYTVLPKLMKLQQEAFRELNKKRRKLPREVYEAYNAYLIELERELRLLKEKIVTDLFLRLKIFEQQNRSPYLITYIVDKLQRRKFTEKDTSIPEPLMQMMNSDDKMTAKIFQDFNQYIEQNGSPEFVSNRLHRLAWFKSDSVLPMRSIPTRDGITIVPEDFFHDTPKRKRWPASIFKGHNFRYEFFRKNKLLFFATINRLTTDSITTSMKLDRMENCIKAYQILNAKEREIANEMRASASFINPFNRFIHRKTTRYIEKWNTLLKTQYSNTIIQKIELAEQLANQLSIHYQNPSLEHFPWEKSHLLDAIINDLNHKQNSDELDHNLIRRLQQLQSESTYAIAAERAMSVIIKCKDMEDINDNALAYLTEYEQSLKLDGSNQERYESFISICQKNLNIAVSRMKKTLKEIRISGERITDLLIDQKNFIRYFELINQFGAHETKEEANNMIFKYFVFFLQEILVGNFDKNKIEQFEVFFEKVGAECNFNGMSVSNYINEFKKERLLCGYDIAYRVNCSALAKQIGEYLFDRRFNKEFNLLEKRIQFVLSDNEFDGRLSSFLRIRQQLIDRNITIETLAKEMEPYERALVGIDCDKYSPIKGILEISALSHVVKRQIQGKRHAYLEKLNLAQSLSVSLGNAFQRNSKLSQNDGYLYTNSGRHRLFSKAYITNEALNVRENQPTIALRT